MYEVGPKGPLGELGRNKSFVPKPLSSGSKSCLIIPGDGDWDWEG